MNTSSSEHSPEALEQLKKNLVYGYRILARYGIGLGLLAHLTARLPAAQTFWSYKWGDSFEDVTVEGLRECDFQGNVLSGDGTVNASLKIEGMLYAARPDINAITHHHADNCLALGAIGQVLQPFERSAARLYEDMVLLQDYDNAHIDPVMAKAFVDALGQRHAVMMQHHGIMVCGRNVQEAVVVTKEVEISAGVQLKAMAAGALRLLPHAEAIRAREHKKTERSYMGVWNYEVGKVNQAIPDLFN